MRTLHELLVNSARQFPDNIAVVDPVRNNEVSYRQLDAISDEIAEMLGSAGIVKGDRVGIYAPKSVASVAALFGIMKAGGGYVPVDYTAPPARNAFIFNDCTVQAIVVSRDLLDGLLGEYEGGLGNVTDIGHIDSLGIDAVLVETKFERDNRSAEIIADDQELSYILYTSGSTGKPKGVIHTHSSSLAFVDWCSEEFKPTPDDKVSSHASFHFDLSILDIYVPIMHAGTLVLIGEDLGKQPIGLAQVIAETGITMWYSTPSILRLLVEFGKLDNYDFSKIRIVNFAGEVFPIKHLRAVKEAWPHPRYFNLYGPTETNVCTYYEIPDAIPEDQRDPFPIGFPCSGDRTKAMDFDDNEVTRGKEGELYVTGGSVLQGYWNLPDRTETAFYVDEDGARWYKTGDVVIEREDGAYIFVGRRDRMVKRRGYRVELGEIEAALYRHENVAEAAIVAIPDEANGVRITAFVSTNDGERIGLIAMKQFCSKNLPLYMIPDKFDYQPELPKTSTDKIDYQKLKLSA
ncbi:MAG: amino acid adenylation domain-containing protein [Rhodothermales bacterium]|nr:amino acid adenylation domain-containing protein [Rhodothermales bacterium]